MTTDLRLTEFAPHEIARLRLIVDSMKDWEQQQKFHSLIDAWEDQEDAHTAAQALRTKLEGIAENLTDSLDRSRVAYKKEAPADRLKRLEGLIKAEAEALEQIAQDLPEAD